MDYDDFSIGHEAVNVPRENEQKTILSDRVNDLLSREMMQLSAEDRNALQEEIHGVRCLAHDETPETVNAALKALSEYLDNSSLIPNHEKQSYILARQLGNLSFVNNSLEFRLRFLRASLFDPCKAAKKICAYLNLVHYHFGGVSLRRPLELYKDFSKEEIREFKKGRVQLLPYRDRSGRRILGIFPDEKWGKIGPVLRTKLFLFITTAAATNDAETQRNGMVVLVWFDPTYRLSLKIPAASRINWEAISCVRSCAIHICHPDTPGYHFRRSVVAMRAGRGGVGKRIKFHVGEPVEVRYSLQAYGIPTETIPITWTGTIKNNVHRNWMKIRNALDGFDANVNIFPTDTDIVSNSDDSGINPNHVMANVVECPSINDVLFRQGTSLYSHPGNARFRSLVEQKVCTNIQSEQSNYSPETSDEDLPMTFSTADVVTDLIDQIINKNKGRVLVWASNYTGEQFGCWCTLTNENQIYSKIEYIVREFLRGVSIINNNNKPATAEGSSAMAAFSNNDSNNINDTINASLHRKHQRNHQTVDSSTSIFRTPDSSSPSNILQGLVHQQQQQQQQLQQQQQSASTSISNQSSSHNSNNNSNLQNKRHKSRESSIASSDGDYSSVGADGCWGFLGKGG